MRQRMKILAIVLAIIVSIGILAPVQAMSKKTGYVMTKKTFYYTSDSKETTKFTYNKEGLLKKSKLTASGWSETRAWTYKYDTKKHITESVVKVYGEGVLYDKYKTKYTNTRKGLIKKITGPGYNGKQTVQVRLYHNKKGLPSTEKRYSANGTLIETVKYSYSKKGLPLKVKTYNKNGKLNRTKKYTYNGNAAKTRTVNSKGTLIESSVVKLKHGNIVSEVSYDEKHNAHAKTISVHYSYKKIKIANSSRTKKQQRDILYYAM